MISDWVSVACDCPEPISPYPASHQSVPALRDCAYRSYSSTHRYDMAEQLGTCEYSHLAVANRQSRIEFWKPFRTGKEE
jgi:hypothetical protein